MRPKRAVVKIKQEVDDEDGDFKISSDAESSDSDFEPFVKKKIAPKKLSKASKSVKNKKIPEDNKISVSKTIKRKCSNEEKPVKKRKVVKKENFETLKLDGIKKENSDEGVTEKELVVKTEKSESLKLDGIKKENPDEGVAGKGLVVKTEKSESLELESIKTEHLNEEEDGKKIIKRVNSEACIFKNANIAPEAGFSGACSNVLDQGVAPKLSKDKTMHRTWKDEEVVAETTNVSLNVAKNVMLLLDQDCTIPFIVRYRKEMTGGLLAEKLRDIQASYEEVKQVHKKVDNIVKTVKHEKFDENAVTALMNAKTLEEVDLLYTPFKPGSKKTLAERSKQLGLGPISVQLIEAKTSLKCVNCMDFINPEKGLKTEKDVMTGIQHIIADTMSKNQNVLDFIRKMSQHSQIRILSCKSAAAEKEDKRAFVEGKKTENFKYENYFQLNVSVNNVAHHQVMALNRGEKQKVLKVKVQIPHSIKKMITDCIWNSFFHKKYFDKQTFDFLRECTEDSYNRLVEPYMSRQIRSDLSKKAEKESIAVFCSNVKSLLLTPPVRGKVVVGIDPGFSHGCKMALVSPTGDVLLTDVIYPHSKKKAQWDFSDAEKLKYLISSYCAEIVAIGNGTACRETETWLSNLNSTGFFSPFEIKYCIVNESGVSIYSVSKEADADLPDMDPNLRSAVGIARRLQDPLLEYVKVEPKHLGVGMYQHDVSETQLKKALDSVVEECVSFVGIDLNVCPEILLRKISGLSASRAKQIIEWRMQNGSFINRQQLLEVKGLGQKSFEQCAGFVKILAETCLASCPLPDTQDKGKKKKKIIVHKPNPLDRTIIHPESYHVAEKFLTELKIDPKEVGCQACVNKVNIYMKFRSVEDVAKNYDVPVAPMQLIIDALKQLQDYDIRSEFAQPLFSTFVRTFSDLEGNQELTGRVTNVTGFGAFVDVGVGKDGLIHVSKMKGHKMNVGEKVSVKVLNVDAEKKRIQLEYINSK